MKKIRNTMLSPMAVGFLAVTLTACASAPQDARVAHDLSGQLRMDLNSVVPEFFSQEVRFAPGAAVPEGVASADEAYDFAPEAVSGVTINTPACDRLRDTRVLALKRRIRGLGIPSGRIAVLALPEMKSGSYRIDYVYSHMETPPCSAWAGTESANFDNVLQSNMGCAAVTNAGQMIADPRDLLRGSGYVRPEADRDAVGIQKYRSDFDWNAAAGASSGNYSTGNAGPSSAVTSTGSGSGQ